MKLFLLLVTSALLAQLDDYATLLEAHRRDNTLAVPKRSPALDAVAARYARELARSGRLSHFDPSGRGPEHRAGVAGIGYVGEVLGFGPDPDTVFRAWLASPGHRQVLNGPGWTQFGAGVFPWKNGHVAVLIFWSPP